MFCRVYVIISQKYVKIFLLLEEKKENFFSLNLDQKYCSLFQVLVFCLTQKVLLFLLTFSFF